MSVHAGRLFSLSHLVRLHGFQHSEASDVDDTDLVTETSAWVEIHQRHDVLRELSVFSVCGDVHNLGKK